MIVATLLIVAALTLLIFTLTISTFSATLRAEKVEIASGHYDNELNGQLAKSKKRGSSNIVPTIVSALITIILMGLATTSIIYRASGEQLSINGHTVMVIATDSMSGYYDDNYKLELTTYKSDAYQQQFNPGDILVFTTVATDDELTLYDVYGYKNAKGYIITHRLVGTKNGKLVFRGDNTGGNDKLVSRDQVLFHYSGHKMPYIGSFILFTKSAFGLYALFSVITVYIITDIYRYKFNKIIQARLLFLAEAAPSEKPDLEAELAESLTGITASSEAACSNALQQSSSIHEEKVVLAQFTRRDGTPVTITKKVLVEDETN